MRQKQARLEDLYVEDLGAWRDHHYNLRRAILVRMRQREAERAAFANRRSAASARRLATLTGMSGAGEEEEREAGKKENIRKGNKRVKDDGDDAFGAQDADWDVYAETGKLDAAEEAAKDAADLNELQAVEEIVRIEDADYSSKFWRLKVARLACWMSSLVRWRCRQSVSGSWNRSSSPI